MVRACHTRTGADRISGLSTGWYTMGQAVGWWSFIISDGIFFYGWLKFIEGCKSKSVDICFFSKHECPQKKTFNHKDLVHSHYQNSETLAHALEQSPNNFESSINGISRPVNSDCIKFSMMIRDIENNSDQLFSKLQIVWRCFLRVYTRMICISYIHNAHTCSIRFHPFNMIQDPPNSLQWSCQMAHTCSMPRSTKTW